MQAGSSQVELQSLRNCNEFEFRSYIRRKNELCFRIAPIRQVEQSSRSSLHVYTYVRHVEIWLNLIEIIKI